MKRAPVFGLLCLCVFLGAFRPRNGEKTYEEFKPHMRAIYQSLMNIYPYTLSQKAFNQKEQAKLIEENLQILADHAGYIERLAHEDESGHSHLSHQLSRNAQQAVLKFKSGLGHQAQFYIQEVYDTCLTCHTSRTSQDDSEFTVDFGKDVNWDAMGGFGRARFLSLSRQFEKAMDEYEKIFLSQQMSLEELLQYDPFVDYMILGLRVKEEKGRVAKTFESLMAKPLPAMVKSDLDAWVKSLKKVPAKSAKQSELAYAKELIKASQSLSEYPQDRKGLVYSILASKELLGYLKQKKIPEAKRAETYYELGLSEMRIGSPQIAGESGYYFEEAIRLAPKAAFSKKAFALYEEGLLFGYSGSGGVNLPASEKQRLEDLRTLVE